MLVKIRAYKSDNYKDGETIVITIDQKVNVCCAEDVSKIIEKLTEARAYALRAEVGDEALEISLTL